MDLMDAFSQRFAPAWRWPVWTYNPYQFNPFVSPWVFAPIVYRPVVPSVVRTNWFPRYCLPCSRPAPAKTKEAEKPKEQPKPEAAKPETKADETKKTEAVKPDAPKTEPATAFLMVKSPTLRRMTRPTLVYNENQARAASLSDRAFLNVLLEEGIITKEQALKIVANMKAPLDPAVKDQIIDKSIVLRSRKDKFDKVKSFDDFHMVYLKTARDEFAKTEPSQRRGRRPDSYVLTKTGFIA